MSLQEACRRGDLEVVKRLVEEKHAPRPSAHASFLDLELTLNGNTPLHTATVHEHVEVMRYLLEQGASSPVDERSGSTLLHQAALNHRTDAVKELLRWEEYAKAAHAKDAQGHTPLSHAVGGGILEMAEVLLEHGVKQVVDLDGRSDLYTAAHHGRVDLIAALLRRDPVFGVEIYNRHTPLFAAAAGGHVGAVRLLAEYERDIVRDVHGQTALHVAAGCYGRSTEVVRELLGLGYGVDDTDANGRTPLYYATNSQNAENVRALLEHGAQLTPEVMALARLPEVLEVVESFQSTTK